MSTTIAPFDLDLMWVLVKKLQARKIPYLWGGKAPSPGCDSNEITKGLDCSGLSDWLAYRATEGDVNLPEGSVAQHEWCEKNLPKANYRGIREFGKGRLFIAFENPEPTGHVWFIDGTTCMTLESYGHHGPGSRQFDLPMFLRIVDACYELPVKQS